jgi:N-acetylglucosamine kinase-like BadF-type ATPase
MSPVSITVDGGASRARARLRDESGAHTVTLDESLSLTTVAPGDVLERLGRLLDQLPEAGTVAAVTVGLAGASNTARAEPVTAALRRRYPRARARVVRDVDLVLAHLDGPGAALVVGTGAVVLAPAAGGGEVMIDGRGFAIGDRGGGAWIALEALRQTLRVRDLQGTEPPLLQALRRELGLATDRGIAAALADAGGPGARSVAALAPVVLALADDGDGDATAIVDCAVDEIAASVHAALRLAACPAGAEIVAAGGVATAPAFARRLKRAVADGQAVVRVRAVDPLDADLTETTDHAPSAASAAK